MTAFCDITQPRNRETEHDTATLLDRYTHTHSIQVCFHVMVLI